MISRLGDITLTNDNAPQNMAFGLFIPWAANQPSAVNVPTNLSSQTRSVPIVIPGFGGNPDTTTNFNLSMVEWNSESVPAGEVRLQFTAPDGVCNPNDSKQAEDIPEEGDPEPFYRVAATDSFPTSTGKVGMSSVAFMSESPIVAGSEVNFIVPQLDDETGVEKIAVYIKKQGGSSGKFNIPSRWNLLTVLNCQEQDCSKGVQPLTLPKDLQPGTYDVALMIADHAKSQNGEHIGIVAPEFIKDTPFGPSTKPCTESTANATYCTTEGLSTTITVGSN